MNSEDVALMLDIDMAVTRIEVILSSMPYGGTYFTRQTQGRGVDGGKMDIDERLERIEANLRALSDGLRSVAARGDKRDSELMRFKQLGYAARDILKMLNETTT
jgi:hypothetical protein